MILSIVEAFTFSHKKEIHAMTHFSGKTRGFRYGVTSDRCKF